MLKTWKSFTVDDIKQETRRDISISRFKLNPGLCGKNHRLLNLVETDAIIEIPHGLVSHVPGIASIFETTAGADQRTANALWFESIPTTVAQCDVKLFLNISCQIAIPTQSAGLAAILTIDNIPTGHLHMPLSHKGLFHGILYPLDFELLPPYGTTEKPLHNRTRHGDHGSLILGRERIVVGNITVSLEGALHGKADAFLIEGFAVSVTLSDGEFSPLKGVNSVQGELAGEWFHGFWERCGVFREKFHKTLYVVSG